MLIKTIDHTTKNYDKFESREAVRAIIKDGDNLLMVFISSKNTFIFPGGGVEEGESLEETCIREALEEAGAVVKVNKYLGFIDEFRDSKFGDMCFNMKSHFYECSLLSMTSQSLEKYEAEYGFEPRFIKVEDALKHNTENDNDPYQRYLERNIQLLTLLSENKL